MSRNRRYLSWFAGGVMTALLLSSFDVRLASLARADGVEEVPSKKESNPDVDVVYDETWEAAEFLAVPRSKLEPPSSFLDGINIQLASSGLGALAVLAGGPPVGIIQITNSIPIRFFSREDVWEPDGSLGEAWNAKERPATGYVGGFFPTGTGGVSALGMPVVTKWRVTGHIHSQE